MKKYELILTENGVDRIYSVYNSLKEAETAESDLYETLKHHAAFDDSRIHERHATAEEQIDHLEARLLTINSRLELLPSEKEELLFKRDAIEKEIYWVRQANQAPEKRPIITLSNGKRVANFSSPHPFTFTDGSVLPAVDDVRSNFLKVDFEETELNDKGDMTLDFTLSQQVIDEMDIWCIKSLDEEIDVVYCCLPMLTALSKMYSQEEILRMPFRAIRMEDRVKKLISIDKQCI